MENNEGNRPYSAFNALSEMSSCFRRSYEEISFSISTPAPGVISLHANAKSGSHPELEVLRVPTNGYFYIRTNAFLFVQIARKSHTALGYNFVSNFNPRFFQSIFPRSCSEVPPVYTRAVSISECPWAWKTSKMASISFNSWTRAPDERDLKVNKILMILNDF